MKALASTSLALVLFSQSFSAQAEMKKVPVDLNLSLITGIEVQADSWSCGCNSSARVIQGYNGHLGKDAAHPVDYGSYRNSSPKTIDGRFSVGALPSTLVTYMNEHSRTVQFEVKSGSSFDETTTTAKTLIDQGAPSILFTKVGEFTLGSVLDPQAHMMAGIFNLTAALEVKIPLIHYVIMNGYDSVTQEYSYVDTDSQEKIASSAEFKQMVDWNIEISTDLRNNLNGLVQLFGNVLAKNGFNDIQGMLSARGDTLIAPIISTIPVKSPAPTPTPTEAAPVPTVTPTTTPEPTPTLTAQHHHEVLHGTYQVAPQAAHSDVGPADGGVVVEKSKPSLGSRIAAPFKKAGNAIWSGVKFVGGLFYLLIKGKG